MGHPVMVLAEGTDSLLMRQKLPEEFKMVAVTLMVLMEHPLQLQCPHFSIHGCFAFVSTKIYILSVALRVILRH